MKLLLDTHVLLWAAGEPERLSPATRTLIEAVEHELVFSERVGDRDRAEPGAS